MVDLETEITPSTCGVTNAIKKPPITNLMTNMNNDCTVCKTNKAVYYILDIVHGSKAESYLCSPCLDKFDTSGLLKLFAVPMGQIAPLNDVKCESCGMTQSEFNKVKKVGCAKDYDLFNLGPLLEACHKSSQHTGKVPMSHMTQETISSKIDSLKKSMEEAIKLEKYEDAAVLRDEINKLKGQYDN